MTDKEPTGRTEDADREVPARHPTDPEHEREEKDKDEAVEESSEGSFPASDPPAW